MDISVVVPVYNTSKFLRQCIDSLINQTWKDVEFIFVDDGSTDNSVEILKEYEKRDARIKVLEQDNMHAGVARNNGMKHATGKYIIFLDSDDFFDLTLLEKAFHRAEKDQAEIVVFNHYFYNNKTGKKRNHPFNMRRGVFSGNSLGEKVFTSFYDAPWNKMYLRSFLTKYHLEFQDILKHNDVYFVSMSIAVAERIVCLNKRLVYYRVNNSESLQGMGTFSYPYLIQSFSKLKQSLTEQGMFQGPYKTAYNKRLSRLIEKRSRSRWEVMFSKQFYLEMKKNLVPNLFDSPQDFADGTVILSAIYESVDYENYVMLLGKRMEDDMLIKISKDYTVGHAVLTIPRFIKRVVRK